MLRDMKVIDLSQQLPGPYASMLLHDLGAHVIKVEPTTGDPARELDPPMFDRINRGKKSVVLDLKSPVGQQQLHWLVARSDVVLEGFRPGATSRLSADWATLKEINPSLVYCSLTGFGNSGPHLRTPVHDMNLQSWGDPSVAEHSSGRIGVPWVDLGAGTSAALAIVAAWHRSLTTGTGAFLDIAMMDTAIMWTRVKQPDLGGDGEPTYGVFPTADGVGVVVAILEDHFWRRLCVALGWEDWRHDSSLFSYADRKARPQEIRDRLSESLSRIPVQKVLDLSDEHDLPITVADARNDPRAMEQIEMRGFRESTLVSPVRTSIEREGPPALGADNAAVFEGFTTDA